MEPNSTPLSTGIVVIVAGALLAALATLAITAGARRRATTAIG